MFVSLSILGVIIRMFVNLYIYIIYWELINLFIWYLLVSYYRGDILLGIMGEWSYKIIFDLLEVEKY